MTLYQIFFWYLKLKNVSCEVRSFYQHNPKLDYSDFYKNSHNRCFIKELAFKDYFDNALASYNWGYDIFYHIFDQFIPYDKRMECSKQLTTAIKKWGYFIKNNIKLDLKEGDVVTFRHTHKGESMGTFKSVIKDNIVKVSLANGKGDIEIPIDMVKMVNDSNPNFYIKRNRNIYNGSKGKQ